MSRYFALPVVATVIALVGLRFMAAPAPANEVPAFVFSLRAQEAEAPAPARAPAVTPPEIRETPAPPPAPRTEPTVIILEPMPAAPLPAPRTEVIEKTVYVPQTTIVYAPAANSYPVVEAAPEPRQDVIQTPVVVFVGLPQLRPRTVHRQAQVQDPFFKTIPFMTALPKNPAVAR
jgi:hypothetical protein